MSRWQLRAILLYSHDSRCKTLSFELNSVNIITGPSGSGKSAICEIIDYCLGADKCHVPGVVRDASSWVGILLSNGSMEAFIARRIPPSNQLSSDETFIAYATTVNLPTSADQIVGATNVSTMLRRLEQLFGIGNVTTETLGAPRSAKKISARSLTPFLIQDDDVIINKTVLLRGAQDERRQTIIDSFPYFLGVVDEKTIAKEQELRRLLAQYSIEERRLSSLEHKRDTTVLELRAIAAEAQQVGLLDLSIQGESVETLRSELQRVSLYIPEQEGDDEGDKLAASINLEKRLRGERVRLMTELEALRDMHREADSFVNTTERQERRLRSVNLFDSGNGPNEICPLCANSITQQTETLTNVRAAYLELQGQLRTVERERPQIDNYIRTLQTRIDEVSRQMSMVRAELAALRRQSDSIQQQLDLAQQRMRVAGRVSYFLETSENAQVVSNSNQLMTLESRISELREELDSASKMDRLQDAQQQVSFSANDILSRLPFAARYPQREVYLNTRDLSTGIRTADRRIPMRDIGSDENYLSLHVAVALGLHRYFKTHSRPVPGFIVFDQLSRPFYPPDKMPGVITTRSDAERGELRGYFDALFHEVEQQQDLQIIVLEHAYFADDERFIKAVGKRFLETEKLIPADWPGVPEE